MKYMVKNYICSLIRKLRQWTTGSMSKEKIEVPKVQEIKCINGWRFYSVNDKLIKVSCRVYYTIRIADDVFANKITVVSQGIEHNISSDKVKNFCFDKEILDQLPDKCFSGFNTDEHFMYEAMYATEEDLK